MANHVAEVVKAFVKPAEMLVDAISKGIGTLYEPHRLKKLADAEAYRIKTIGQALSENADLPVKYDNGDISVDLTEYESLQKRAVCRFARQETQRQFNLENIADKAYDLLKDQQPQSDETVSQDWMTRFINNAQDVSDEDVQNLWSRILAGEITQPKSVSIKTLDVIRNLSKEDALLFERILPHIINGKYLLRDDAFLETVGIIYSDILRLDECGLINSSGFIHQNFTVGKTYTHISNNANYGLFCTSENTQKISIPEHVLTKAGQELFYILQVQTNDDSFISSARAIKKLNTSVNWFLFKVKSKENDMLTFEDSYNYLEDIKEVS